MKIKIIISVLVVFVLFHFGCKEDFLDVEPTSSLTSNSFYKTEEDAKSAINAAYASLQTASMYSERYPKVVSGTTDDLLLINTSDLSIESWTFTASLGPLDNIWQACYEGIFRANLIFQNIPEMDINAGLKDRILGEARFLRALYYWHLTTLLGEVPLITEADPTDVYKAAKPKSSVSEIYSLMIDDLKKASALLPKRSEYSSSDLGRAAKGAAQSLLGKTYLYDEDYPMAETYFDSVLTSNEYELIDDFSKLWIQDNNLEQIFEVQYQQVGGSIWAVADAAGNDETQLRGYLNYPRGFGGFANLMPRQDIVDEFEDYNGASAINGKDPRLFYSIFRDGDPYDSIDPVYQAEWVPQTGYTMKKGLYPVIRNEGLSYNIVLIRLADVILMDAEAANENNKPGKAVDLLNDVRDRVAMPNYPTPEYPVGNKEEIFDAIVHERRVELAFEYHRLNDLKRWDLAEQELSEYGYVAPKHRYFPIPQEEVDTNPELQQNPNY